MRKGSKEAFNLAPNHEAPKKDNLEAQCISTEIIMMSQETKGEGNPSISEKDSDNRVSHYVRSTKKKDDGHSSKDQGIHTWRMLNLAAICATRVRATPIS